MRTHWHISEAMGENETWAPGAPGIRDLKTKDPAPLISLVFFSFPKG